MEDDDLAVVSNGALTIHRTQHGEVLGQPAIRAIHELKIELQQIMKGIQFFLYKTLFLCSRFYSFQVIINILCKKKFMNNQNQLLIQCVVV